jgi:malate dehydrogenase (oxaloacetate-decarboxylating)
MADCQLRHYYNAATDEEILEGAWRDHLILNDPLLNKGRCYTEEECREFGLIGLIPPNIATIEEQLARTYGNYQKKQTDLDKYMFMLALQDRNEVLFYRLLHEHITEMMPIVYTPVVGTACQQYSRIYRRPRGLYISYVHRKDISTMLDNCTQQNVEVIVVTDGERILGLGDLGIGGMGIPVGKLTLYSACAGIHPATTLPMIVDVGTNNEELLRDPLYLGWRHQRLRGKEYDEFIETFVQAVMKKWPHVLFQWEDFAKDNAARLLDMYQNRLCTFNDDIQGTGAVTLAGLLAALNVTKTKLSQHRIVMLGAGSATNGVSEQMVVQMVAEGLSEQEARETIWVIDTQGLVHSGRSNLDDPFKKKFAQPVERIAEWQIANKEKIFLKEVVENVRPTILIGCSTQPGIFTEDIVKIVGKAAERPIIFPLSNPTSKCEGKPEEIIAWTEGRALVATGSPFPDVSYKGRTIRIGQCNNAFIFPGVGLGVIASHASRVTTGMFVQAAHALARMSPALKNPDDRLFPVLENIRDVSKQVAIAVALEAQRIGVADRVCYEDLVKNIQQKMWYPHYPKLRLKK